MEGHAPARATVEEAGDQVQAAPAGYCTAAEGDGTAGGDGARVPCWEHRRGAAGDPSLAIGIAVVVEERHRAPRSTVRYGAAEPVEANQIARMDVAMEVRHSAYWGCHRLYDVERINFLAPNHDGSDKRGDEAAHNDSVTHTPFMQDEL
jgi:hypothetical protein